MLRSDRILYQGDETRKPPASVGLPLPLGASSVDHIAMPNAVFSCPRLASRDHLMILIQVSPDKPAAKAARSTDTIRTCFICQGLVN
jgi:hypothetical protein